MARKPKEEFTIEDGILKSYNGNKGEVQIPDGVVEIGDRAFSANSRIHSVQIPDSVKKIGRNAFYLCTGLIDIHIPANVEELDESAFWMSNIENVVIDNPDIKLTDSTFGGCKFLADENGFVIINNILFGYYGNEECVTIPDYVTQIGSSAFSDNRIIKKVNFPSNLKCIGERAFSYCKSLTEISLSGSVEHIGYKAFQFCSNLFKISGGSDQLILERMAFDTCSSLKMVELSEDAVISDDAFQGCRSLKQTIPKKGLLIERNGLYYRGKEKSYIVPDYIKSLISFGSSECERLIIPSHVEQVHSLCQTKLKYIEFQNSMDELWYDFFKDSTNLETVVLPKGLRKIYDNVFAGCISLKEVILPDTVEYIGENAFNGCNNLSVLILPKSIDILGHICGTKPEMPIIAPHISFKSISAGYKISMLRGFVRAEQYHIIYSEEEIKSYITYIKRNKKKLQDNQSDEILLTFLEQHI